MGESNNPAKQKETAPTKARPETAIPDHELLRCVGEGSYGEIWLARSVTGAYRAIKIVCRRTFDEARPYEREFLGIRKFEPISRHHPGFVSILHIGNYPTEGYFYYVMELADDLLEGQTICPERYVPKTLARMIAQKGRLPVRECVEIGLALTSALAHLHAEQLIHRDIKPSNIIFVGAQPKFADIGLVTGMGPNATFVGTKGYYPPEGPGSPCADLFSLGKVLYEIALGKDAEQFPELPTSLHAEEDLAELMQLNRVILKACEPNPRRRFQSADELRQALVNIITPKKASSPDGRSGPQAQAKRTTALEQVGGAVPLNSKFYVMRVVDAQLEQALARHDSIVLIEGARQMGKTSLLARGLQQARERGEKVALTDCQKLNTFHLESAQNFFFYLAETLAEQLEIPVPPEAGWDDSRGAGVNFEHFFRRDVLPRLGAPLVWGLDEVDRLFASSFGSEVFGLFRSWHNERELDPAGPWRKLTLTITYATEAHLFISDINQSPFNVGTRLLMGDFSPEQVRELNQRHGVPLNDEQAVVFFNLLKGHPFLTRSGLGVLAAKVLTWPEFQADAVRDEGIFGDHLKRILVLLTRDPGLLEVVREILAGRRCPTRESFFRLRSAGVMAGASPEEAHPRCELYAAFLTRHLLSKGVD